MPLPFQPALRSSLNKDPLPVKLVDGYDLHPAINFSRSSSKWVFDETGTLVEVPADTPAFDHDPETGELKGLLIEEQRTNWCKKSSDIPRLSSGWNTSKLEVQVLDTNNPTGELAVNISSATGKVARCTTGRSGNGAATLSFFARATTENDSKIRAEIFSSLGEDGAQFDLFTGELLLVESGYNAGMIYVWGGWYYCFVTRIGDYSGVFDINRGDTMSFSVDVVGFQFEEGRFPTSYIPTNGTAVTRAADQAEITDLSLIDFVQGSGSMLSQTSLPDEWVSTGYPRIWGLWSSSSERMSLAFWPDSNTPTFVVLSSGTVRKLEQSAPASGQLQTQALAWRENDLAFYCTGGDPVTYTATTYIPLSTIMSVGFYAIVNTDSFLNGSIRKLHYFPRRLTNDQLQRLIL